MLILTIFLRCSSQHCPPGCLPAWKGGVWAEAIFCAARGLAAAVWIWLAASTLNRALRWILTHSGRRAITGMVLWACAVAGGFRVRHRLAKFRRAAAVGLLAVLALGLEVFVCNLNFWATPSYTPVDLRPYLTEDADPEAPLTLDEEHNTLTFAGLDRGTVQPAAGGPCLPVRRPPIPRCRIRCSP